MEQAVKNQSSIRKFVCIELNCLEWQCYRQWTLDGVVLLRSFAAPRMTASIFIIWLGLYVFTTMKLKQAKHSTHTLHFHFERSEGKESDENVR
jgi:hypothetical protein